MQIVELGDYSMVIMKDSEDPPWRSVGDIYRVAKEYGRDIVVDTEQLTINYIRASDYLYTAGRLVLFFKDHIPPRFCLHSEVVVRTVAF